MRDIQSPAGIVRLDQKLSRLATHEVIAFTRNLAAFQQGAIFRALLKHGSFSTKPTWYDTFALYAERGPFEAVVKQAWQNPASFGPESRVKGNLTVIEGEEPAFYDADTEAMWRRIGIAGAIGLPAAVAMTALACVVGWWMIFIYVGVIGFVVGIERFYAEFLARG